MKNIIKKISIISLVVLLYNICTACTNNIVNKDSIDSIHPYDWDLYEEGYTALAFDYIYYIDTTNMVIYYDNYDQFDMDFEYERNPNNINEDGTLILHISKDNLVELMNRILQWIQFRNDYAESLYTQSMFGIGKTEDGCYYITYLGN